MWGASPLGAPPVGSARANSPPRAARLLTKVGSLSTPSGGIRATPLALVLEVSPLFNHHHMHQIQVFNSTQRIPRHTHNIQIRR